MSDQKEILVHRGAGISDSGLDVESEAFLAALVRGELPINDEDDFFSHILLRCRIQHAFTTEAERVDTARRVLDIWDREPDDAGTIKMVSGWLDELYGVAPHILRQAR